jgi:hypothetical protein
VRNNERELLIMINNGEHSSIKTYDDDIYYDLLQHRDLYKTANLEDPVRKWKYRKI